MNEPAIRLEEQIINLFPNFETEIYQGWVLKETPCHLVIYPLYGSSDKDIVERIKVCEEVSRQKSLSCEFRIVEHTNYHLASRLEECGYDIKNCCIVAERYMNEGDFSINRNSYEESGKSKVSLSKMAETDIIENIVAEGNTVIGIKRQELLYLPNGKLPCSVDMDDIFQLAVKNQVSRILADISENGELLAYYEKAGFHKAYLYRCYQKENIIKEDIINGFTE